MKRTILPLLLMSAASLNAATYSLMTSNEVVAALALKANKIDTGTVTNDTIVADVILQPWSEVTPTDTNSVLDLTAANNFYYILTTSNYLSFDPIVAGASGYVKIFSDTVGQEINFPAEYNYIGSYTPVFTNTNWVVFRYFVDFGTDSTNVNLQLIDIK